MRSTSWAVLVWLVAASSAHAQTVTLVCSPGPNQPAAETFEIDYGRSVVSYPRPGTPIRVTERTIQWEVPRHTNPEGLSRAGGRFRLDRVTGEFVRDYYCDGCGLAVLYCKPGAKLF